MASGEWRVASGEFNLGGVKLDSFTVLQSHGFSRGKEVNIICPEGIAFKYEVVVHAAPEGRTFNNRGWIDRRHSPAGADQSMVHDCE